METFTLNYNNLWARIPLLQIIKTLYYIKTKQSEPDNFIVSLLVFLNFWKTFQMYDDDISLYADHLPNLTLKKKKTS